MMSSSITPTSGDLTLIISGYHGVNPVKSFFTVFVVCLEAFVRSKAEVAVREQPPGNQFEGEHR